MEAVPKSLLCWAHNCFCWGLLFWASFWISLLGTKLAYLICAKSLFLSSIFIKFFTNTHYDFKLSTKRKAGHVIILLCSAKEIPNSKEKERNGVLKCTEKSSLTLIQLLLCVILLPFFPPIFFHSQPEWSQANKLKLKENPQKIYMTKTKAWIYSSSDFKHTLQFSLKSIAFGGKKHLKCLDKT